MVILFARRLCGDGFTKKGLSEGEMGLSMALLGYNPCKIFVNASPFRYVSGVVVLLARTPKKLCWEGFSTGLDLLVLYKLARFRVAERWNQLYIVCRRMDGTRVQFGATWVVLPFYFNLCY